jgi:hypothetical protein
VEEVVVKIRQVTYEALSSLTHTVWLSEHGKFETPECLMVKFAGIYRSGSDGPPDATYIMAATKAAHEAWFSMSVLLDFTDLEYTWGDNMEWVLRFPSMFGWSGCEFPLVILAGDRSRAALKTLFGIRYDACCRETFNEAVELLAELRAEFGRCTKASPLAFLARQRTRKDADPT